MFHIITRETRSRHHMVEKHGILKFDRKGYTNWKTRLLMLICVENLEMAMDPTKVASKGFKSKDNRCLQLIMQTLANTHLSYIKNSLHVYKVLNKLDEIYNVTNQEAVLNLCLKWQTL